MILKNQLKNNNFIIICLPSEYTIFRTYFSKSYK